MKLMITLWLLETIQLLKQSRFDELDLENLIEELESLAKRDKHQVKSLLEQVIRHLLLLQFWTQEYDKNKIPNLIEKLGIF
jgi:ABC-type uncharacterized transport system substrate-binding protein